MNLGFIGTGKIASSVITDDAILPVPINPKFINSGYFILIILN